MEEPEAGMQAGETLTIDGRFCGPPGSANGGYACGLAAGALTGGPASVTLRHPPPLQRPLRVQRSEDTVALLDGETVVAEARRAEVEVDVPTAISLAAARDAAERFDVQGYADTHPFPGCFSCGPARGVGDGLRLFPAPAGEPPGAVVWPWTPDASLADGSGLLSAPAVWAALDCPSGLAWITAPEASGPAVLGRMAAVVHRRPAPGEELVVAGWPILSEGRKLHAGSVVWSATGEPLAVGAATWIVLGETQRGDFGVVDGPSAGTG